MPLLAAKQNLEGNSVRDRVVLAGCVQVRSITAVKGLRRSCEMDYHGLLEVVEMVATLEQIYDHNPNEKASAVFCPPGLRSILHL